MAVVAELQNIQGFLMNSMQAVFEKMDDTVSSINSVLDYLKDTNSKREKSDSAETAKKSASAAGKTSSTGDMLKGFSLKDISDNIVQLSKGLIVFAAASALGGPKAFVKFLEDMQNVLTGNGALKNPAQIQKMYEAIGGAVKNLGDGLSSFSMGLIMFAIPAKLKLTDLFIKFVEEFFSPKVMGKLDSKKATEVGNALSAVATGILKFAGYLMLATLAMVIGAPGLVIILPAMFLVLGVLSIFSKKSKQIEEGSNAIKNTAIGLLAFTGALILMRFVRGEDLLMAIGVIAVFGLFVLMLGLIGKIVKGGLDGLKKAGAAVAYMAAGLMVFTLSLLVMNFVSWEAVLKSIVVIAVFGLFLTLMGNTDNIMKGSFALLIASVSIVILAFAIKMYADIEWETIGKVAACIGGLTLSLYILGTKGTSVIFGAVSLIISAAAVGALAFALKMWQDQGITEDTLIMAGLAIGGLTVALVALGLVGPVVIVGALTLAIVALSFSASLLILSVAFGKFKAIGWTDEDTGILSNSITGLMVSVSTGFIKAGGPLIYLALPALGAAALVVSPIINALEIFKKSGITSADADEAGKMVENFIGAVRAPIQALAAGGGLFSDSDFKNGLDSIDGLGNTVAEIAKGVLAASKLEYKGLDGKIVKITPDAFAAVGTNVAAMIDALKKPIMEIGSNSKPAATSGLLGALGVGMLLPDDNDFRQGMKAIHGIGSLLSEIAKGVLEMSKLEFRGLDKKIIKIDNSHFTAVGTNVASLINAMKAPIIEIGAGGGLFSDSDFENGMEAVGGLGSFLSGIAAGTKEMAAGSFEDPANPKGPRISIMGVAPQVAKTVGMMIDALKGPISDAGKKTKPFDTSQGGIGGFFGGIGNAVSGTLTMFSDSDFQNGMEALGGLGGLLSGIAGAIKTFGVGKIQDPSDKTGNTWIDVNTLLPKMGMVFSLIISGMKAPISMFASMDEDTLDTAKTNVKNAENFVKGIGSIVMQASTAVLKYNETKGFSTSFPAATLAINLGAANLMGKGVFSNPKDVDNFAKMTAGLVKLADADNKLKGVAVSMKSISDSMVKMFTSLNTVLETKLVAVATLLDKLVALDRVNPEELQKKVDAYKTYIEEVRKMDSETIKKMGEMQGQASASQEEIMKGIQKALADLAALTGQSNGYLKKIVNNTYDGSSKDTFV